MALSLFFHSFSDVSEITSVILFYPGHNVLCIIGFSILNIILEMYFRMHKSIEI